MKKTSQTDEKLTIGAASCNWAFLNTPPSSEEEKAKLATFKCILSKIDSITDDQSGTKVVTQCANSSNYPEFGRALARRFSQTARMEELLEEQRQKLEAAAEEARQREELNRPIESDKDGEIVMMQINGRLKTCIRIAGTLDCE